MDKFVVETVEIYINKFTNFKRCWTQESGVPWNDRGAPWRVFISSVVHRVGMRIWKLEASIDEGLAVEESAFARIVPSHDAQEGVAAFLQKRGAEFLGR